MNVAVIAVIVTLFRTYQARTEVAVVCRRGVAHNGDSQTARKTPPRLATPNGVLLKDECIQIRYK